MLWGKALYPTISKIKLGITPPMRGKAKKGLSKRQRDQDHPRLCGEKVFFGNFSPQCQGSPPPMRGKVSYCPPVDFFIDHPRLCGEKPYFYDAVTQRVGSPRLCGEKKEAERKLNYDRGSPPPMRGKSTQIFGNCFFDQDHPAYAGKRSTFKTLELNDRITPAYAGKSFTKGIFFHSCKGSPRLCGEKLPVLVYPLHVRDHPLPMREKVFPADPIQKIIRITPRLCGEKFMFRCKTSNSLGSPPPMRGKASRASMTLHRSGITPAYAGKRDSSRKSTRPWRITPAYAGKSSATKRKKCVMRDHPRLCGEKSYILNFVLLYSGSPPPMRGKGQITPNYFFRGRITPAYAGKRLCKLYKNIVCRDHPRLCGEKQFRAVPPDGCVGSPPPMRGKED